MRGTAGFGGVHGQVEGDYGFSGTVGVVRIYGGKNTFGEIFHVGDEVFGSGDRNGMLVNLAEGEILVIEFEGEERLGEGVGFGAGDRGRGGETGRDLEVGEMRGFGLMGDVEVIWCSGNAQLGHTEVGVVRVDGDGKVVKGS
jgi:hypothetical protein